MPQGGRVIILQRIGKNYLVSELLSSLTIQSRGFAINAGLKFRTPEEFFLGQAPAPATAFDPTSYVKVDPSEPSM